MAAAPERSEGFFWTNDGMDKDVRGQNLIGQVSSSSKRDANMGTKHSSDSRNEAPLKKDGKKQGHIKSDPPVFTIKEKVPLHASAECKKHITSPSSGSFLGLSQVLPETSRTKSQVCLKDLCPEDKRRIAKLIQELARVSEEKEESVQRLKDEQEHFEHKIQQLEQQNVVIAQERESLQHQYSECHELLGLYQQYLSQQQERLNQSIAQVSQQSAHHEVLSAKEAPSTVSANRANGSLCDGSYLSIAATRARQHRMNRNQDRGRGAKTSSNNGSFSCVREVNPSNGSVKQHRFQKDGCIKTQSESHTCEHCRGSNFRTCQQRTALHPENGRHESLNRHECESGYAMDLDDKAALTAPLLGHEDWEEKRHQLLLQKMQLEMEKERLQARLAEQEERLHKQNQMLCQSRLNYSRFQQSTQAELISSVSRNGDPQQAAPSSQHSSSSVCEEAVVHNAGHTLNEELARNSSAPQNSIHSCRVLERSRRDVGTSPPKSPSSVSTAISVPVMKKTPEGRLDFSVNELLDIFSPISAPRQCKTTTRKHRMSHSGHRPALSSSTPVCRPLVYSARPQSVQHNQEERQMLEDIFFIY